MIPKTLQKNKKENCDLLFYCLKWLLIALIILVSLGFITKPIRKHWAGNYLKSGDSYLVQKKYKTAALEYKKSLVLFWKTPNAKERIKLANDAALDGSKLYSFYKEKNISMQLNLISETKNLPGEIEQIVKKSREMIEKEEYQYAIIVARNATETDKTYRDGWLYLGIANFKAAENLELSKSEKDYYLRKAKEALQKAQIIDPEYPVTKGWFEKVGL